MLRVKQENLYNPEVKLEYLESFEREETAYIASFIFKRAKTTEEVAGKDIYEMTRTELGRVMSGQSASSEDSAYIKTVQLEQYIDWAIKTGKTENNLNPLSDINKREWAAQYVATYKRSGFTREEILAKCETDIVNFTDKAVLLAIFEGIGGEGYSEILNLRTEDLQEIDGKYFATLYKKSGESRTIEISNVLYDYLKRADQDTEYINKNGNVESDRWSISKLLDSPYIFKKTTRGKQQGSLDVFYVNRKFQIYKEVFGLKYLRSKNIENSGIMHMANELYKRDGEFKTDHIKEIAEQYDTTISKIGGKEERVTSVIKLLLQSDLFEELYGYKLIK